MEWIPLVFFTFKFIVLGTGMFFAIKWHYDQGRKTREKRAVLRAGGKVAAIFVLALLAVAVVTYLMVRTLGMDLHLP
ncbi:hypothetical protein DUPY_15400 [Duganella phyllosphaerae]|uniref:Uncharacterized protein n=2 Tax=Duganella phyllosphaerae TaxID=762836 RepID=A0A1E7WZX2_9BURK|nr:hypothetical protein DUPY_15400 [Duganella phyllosphaerae]